MMLLPLKNRNSSITNSLISDSTQDSQLSDTAKKVASHAVRTATNMHYHDAILLRNAILDSDDLRLGILVCRMHWYPQYWGQIRDESLFLQDTNFVEAMSMKTNLFGYLMLSFAWL